MEVLKVDLQNEDEVAFAVRRVSEVLRVGGVVMHPTDTCYGLAVDVFNEKGLRRLYEIKGRDFNKPVSVMVASVDDAHFIAKFSDKAEELANRFLPGALTLVLPVIEGKLPEFFNNGMDAVGIRVPDYDFVRRMLVVFGGVLTTTSANVAGNDEVYVVEDFLEQIKCIDGIFPDLVIDVGRIEKRLPSTIVSVRGDVLVLLRQGGIVLE